MRRIVRAVIVSAALVLIPALSAGLDFSREDSQKARVDLTFRSFQPGEIVRLEIQAASPIRSARIKFQDRKIFPARGSDRTRMLAFIGLDLGLKPGDYRIEIDLQFEDGRIESQFETVVVLDKVFPEKRLWVEEAYVTPPASVQDRIRRESELLRGVYEILTPQWLGEGRFLIPVEGEIVPNFGERRIFNNQPRSPHSGVDISSPSGTPVKSSNSGRVVLASDLYFSGQTVVVDHGAGVFSLYCHFSKILVERGEFVKRGDVIGEIGATGRVTGPHLHWAFRANGSRVDPLSLVSLEWDD